MMVESLYGLPVPEVFADLAKSTDLRNTVGRIRANLLTSVTMPNQLEKFRWHLQFLPRRDAYLSMVRAALVPTVGDWRTFSVPDVLYPIYYLLRPLRLLTKYCGKSDQHRS
jgi:hypothetical protein